MIAAGVLAGSGFLGAPRGARAAGALMPLTAELSRIERDSGGRLGVAILDTKTSETVGQHADDRFPMCSTFKLLATAAVLKRVEDGKEHLDRRIVFKAGDVVVNSPITKEHAGGDGMSLEELCEAAMTYSDNTAGNLILSSIGGPKALTAFARSLGDTTTRLDRIEPELNDAVPGDLRDTTTPAAMLKNLQTLMFGATLWGTSKEHLSRWLLGNKTGDTRLRALLPEGYRVGDKTGAGEHGTTNDVGIIWPPDRQPVIVSLYLTETTASAEQRNAALAAVGRAIADAIKG
jgi:beta-lactamase class A